LKESPADSWAVTSTPPDKSLEFFQKYVKRFGERGFAAYAESAYDKRTYEFTVSASGYVALCVVDQVGESISGWIFAADGTQLTVKPGNTADVYTSSYAVAPGTYAVKVGQDNMVTESNFEMHVYFSLARSIDDLNEFGPRVRPFFLGQGSRHRPSSLCVLPRADRLSHELDRLG
jgi:hypothetical protein